MTLLQKLKYYSNWNIGFCEQTPEELIRDKRLKPVKWLKHSYKDRWFADPFIYKVTEGEIIVFVEECPMENPKGIICELVIERKTMRLKNRYVLLEKDTHLSYPAIIRHEGKIYVYPENGASGKQNIYEYDDKNHKLINPKCILDEAVADATIIMHDGGYFMTATKFPDTQKNLYLYHSESLSCPFKQIKEEPIQKDFSCSRNGGNYFIAYNNLYRPAQNCSVRYGGALTIMLSKLYQSQEKEVIDLEIRPQSWRYSLGIHTINFQDQMCVVDGYGYIYPSISRALYFMKSIIQNTKNVFNL